MKGADDRETLEACTRVMTDVNQIQIYSLDLQGLQGLGTGSSSSVAGT